MHLLCVSRFEAFVRSEVEDLALRASQNAAKFSHLPKIMRQNVTELAAAVLGEPRKYRMENLVVNIAQTLARNLSDASITVVIFLLRSGVNSELMGHHDSEIMGVGSTVRSDAGFVVRVTSRGETPDASIVCAGTFGRECGAIS